MRPDLKVATYAYGGIPFEAQVDMAVQAEADGWDTFAYWDQANGWTPKSIYTRSSLHSLSRSQASTSSTTLRSRSRRPP